jgi:hypothetical protein
MAIYFELIDVVIENTYKKICANTSCNSIFLTSSKNKQYCSNCEDKINKEKSKIRSKNYRNSIKDK